MQCFLCYTKRSVKQPDEKNYSQSRSCQRRIANVSVITATPSSVLVTIKCDVVAASYTADSGKKVAVTKQKKSGKQNCDGSDVVVGNVTLLSNWRAGGDGMWRHGWCMKFRYRYPGIFTRVMRTRVKWGHSRETTEEEVGALSTLQ